MTLFHGLKPLSIPSLAISLLITLFLALFCSTTSSNALRCFKCRNSNLLDENISRTYIQTAPGTACDLEEIMCTGPETFCLAGTVQLKGLGNFTISGCYADKSILERYPDSDVKCLRHEETFPVVQGRKEKQIPSVWSTCLCRRSRCNDKQFFDDAASTDTAFDEAQPTSKAPPTANRLSTSFILWNLCSCLLTTLYLYRSWVASS